MIIMHAPESHSGLIFGISEVEDKGHTFGQKPCIFMFKNIYYRKTKQEQQFLSSMIALRDISNIESVCT